MNNLIQDTIEKIEKQQIAPEPRWKYLLKKYGLWLFFATILILAALSFSVIFDNTRNLDWDLHRFMHQSELRYYFSILPYFWIILSAIFLAGAFFEIRKTETGYRFSWTKILLITIGGIAILGISISSFGFGGRLNSKLANDVPFYGRHMIVTKESQWMQPEKGFLAGTIQSVSRENIGLEDLDDEGWNVSLDENTLIRPSVNMAPQEMIKMIGTKTDESNFKAKEIRPWEGKGIGNAKMMKNGGMRRGNQ